MRERLQIKLNMHSRLQMRATDAIKLPEEGGREE